MFLELLLGLLLLSLLRHLLLLQILGSWGTASAAFEAFLGREQSLGRVSKEAEVPEA